MGDRERSPFEPELHASGSPLLPRNFRKLSIGERREALRVALSRNGTADLFNGGLEWPDAMVESAVGAVPVPFGVATGFIIDGKSVNIPMAVEEPSVIAAATFAGTLIASAGGLRTWASEPVMVSQLFLEGVPREGATRLLERKEELEDALTGVLASMQRRGGGYRGIEVTMLEELGIVRLDLLIDVRDAMGANLINTAAEEVRAKVEEISGGSALMCILTNEALHRRAGASFSLPLARLRRGKFDGKEAGRRIAMASEIARVDPSRAVTHNKGIMNGISALALATGNDTRGIEAAAHRWASRDGHYRGISRFWVEGDSLTGEIELPLPLATKGGSVGFHPATRTALALLGDPDSQTLARIGAALGLSQNFAALHAIVTEGIQRGHMRMHYARLALRAGARGTEVRRLAERIAKADKRTLHGARELLKELRAGRT